MFLCLAPTERAPRTLPVRYRRGPCRGRRSPLEGGERRFARPRQDRLIAGVASCFARHAEVDVNLVRVALVVLAVWSYGIGLVLYLALAALLPEDRAPA